MSDEEIPKLIASNTQAIQALAGSIDDLKREWQKDRDEWKKDRRGLYELLGRLTRSMSDFYEIQSDFYRRFDQIDEREERMIQVLKELTEKEEKREDS